MEQGLVDQTLLRNCAVLDGEATKLSACLSLRAAVQTKTQASDE